MQKYVEKNLKEEEARELLNAMQQAPECGVALLEQIVCHQMLREHVRNHEFVRDGVSCDAFWVADPLVNHSGRGMEWIMACQ